MNGEQYETLKGVVAAAAVLYFPRVRDFAEIEDLEQEAWVAVIEAINLDKKRREEGKEATASLLTFAYPKIHWALKDYCKKLKSQRCLVSMDEEFGADEGEYSDAPRTLHDLIGCAPTQEDGLMLNDVRKEIERKFPKQTAEIILLRAQGYSYDEIGKLLELTPKAAQVAFSRAYNSAKRKAA